MTRQLLRMSIAIALLAGSSAHAQTARTPWGHPDLQGRWSNGTLTPLQRPAELGDKSHFNEDEARAYVQRRIETLSGDRNVGDGSVGSYNDAWMDRGSDVVPTRRTSLVIDPPNGRVPPFTARAQEEHERNLERAKLHPADTPADRYLTERCIVFGGGAAPMLPEPYNNNYYIVQTPDYVTIMAEINHEIRIIPLDGRSHLPEDVRQWAGDSRGRWDGETLVVETTNQRPHRHFYGVQMLDSVMSDAFRVVETFTRTAADQIRYRATVHDPEVFTQPWTIELFMHPQRGPLVEFACHEGNYGLRGVLSAERADEQRAAEAGADREGAR